MAMYDPNVDWEAFLKLRRANRGHVAYIAFGEFLSECVAKPSHEYYKWEMIPGGFRFYWMRNHPIRGQEKVPVHEYWFDTEDAENCTYERI